MYSVFMCFLFWFTFKSFKILFVYFIYNILNIFKYSSFISVVFCWMRCPLCAMHASPDFMRAWPQKVLVVAYGQHRHYLPVAWHWLRKFVIFVIGGFGGMFSLGFWIDKLGY